MLTTFATDDAPAASGGASGGCRWPCESMGAAISSGRCLSAGHKSPRFLAQGESHGHCRCRAALGISLHS